MHGQPSRPKQREERAPVDRPENGHQHTDSSCLWRPCCRGGGARDEGVYPGGPARAGGAGRSHGGEAAGPGLHCGLASQLRLGGAAAGPRLH